MVHRVRSLDGECRTHFFTEKNVYQLAIRYDPKCRRQYAAFSVGTGDRGENELVAVVNDYGSRKVFREVGTYAEDTSVAYCPEVSGAVVAQVLGLGTCRILVQPIDWARLGWFFDTERGRGLRRPSAV